MFVVVTVIVNCNRGNEKIDIDWSKDMGVGRVRSFNPCPSQNSMVPTSEILLTKILSKHEYFVQRS